MIDTIVRPVAAPRLWLACLCAAWCRTCDAYEQTLAAVATEFPDFDVRWVDIEDEADALDDVDVETFPTIVIADADRLLFAGPITPEPGSLRRLMQAATDGSLIAQDPDPGLAAVARRLRSAGDSG